MKKSPFYLKLLIWACNLVIGILAAQAVVLLFTFPNLNRLIPVYDTNDNTGVIDKSITFNMFGDTYTYELKLNSKGGHDESFIWLNRNQLFKFDPASRPEISLQSSEASKQSIVGGLADITVSVSSEEHTTLPIRIGHPGIELKREAFISQVRSLGYFQIVLILYFIGMTWLLRGFASGLKAGQFFEDQNLNKLSLLAKMLIVLAPLSFLGKSMLMHEAVYANQLSLWEEGIPLGFEWYLLAFGVVLLVVSWCFSYGSELQKEQALTI